MEVIIAIIWFGLAIATGAAARSRGRSGFGWFLLAAIISPLIALILLMAFRQRHAGPSKQCKFCRSEIDRDAMVCPHCQREVMTAGEVEIEQASIAKAKRESYGVALGIAVLILLALALNHKPLP